MLSWLAALVLGVSTQTFPNLVGIELDGLGDGSRSKPFVDVAKTLRPWTKPNSGDRAPVDGQGWPTSDADTVLFDIRPFGTWAPPVDDPEKFMPDWSGTYHVEFQGQARVGFGEGRRFPIRNQKFDAVQNRTSLEVDVPKGEGLLILQLRETKRSANFPIGSGITGLRVIRPGYLADTKATFTREFLEMLRPFRVLRYMDWLDTNHNPGFYGDAGHHALDWKDRKLSTDATQVFDGRAYGAAWEYVVELTNATKTDAWINVPIAATDDYVRKLAEFLKKNLRPESKIYIEHSNEVWNFGFPQYIYNKLAALEEVKHGDSPLNNDGEKNEERLAHRRHAYRLFRISEIFAEVFGKEAINRRVRPVYASWVIQPDSHYRDVLAWMENSFGPTKGYFYSLAVASYYNAHDASPTATPDQVLDAMLRSSDAAARFLDPIKGLADKYGLKFMQYEIGPDTGGGNPVNVANRIRANRLPRMKEIVLHDARRWFAKGGDLYMYFAGPGAYSRHGCWGISEDVVQLDTPKWQAIYEVTGFKR